jgi:hypothetical protein
MYLNLSSVTSDADQTLVTRLKILIIRVGPQFFQGAHLGQNISKGYKFN